MAMRNGGSLVLLGGMGAGAGLMFLLDPRSGRRRRAQLRQKIVHEGHVVTGAAGKSLRDLLHRSRGLAARARGAVAGREAPDEVLEERVRAALGRACSHPGAIEVHCKRGQIQLAGAVLAAERDAVRAAASGVRGVKGITDQLETHENPAQVSQLQGGHSRRDNGPRRWMPATSLMVGLGGLGLLAAGARSRSRFGRAAAGVGGALLARALLNAPLGALLGLGSRWRGIQVQKSIHVRAPVEEVFACWSNLESFPRFMTHVKEVKRTADRRYRWRVGPFHWDAEVLHLEANRLLAWRTVSRGMVRNGGSVIFRPDGPRGTEIAIRLWYRPPAGLIGHGVAKLFGVDPKHEIDEDLLRFKSLLEQGSATGRGPRVTRDEIRPA
jgi:uncharacterized membrane protein